MDVHVMFSCFVILLFLHTACCSYKAAKAKCTPNDKREKLYPECMQADNLVLWCDYSNYTSIPDPNTIYMEKSCSNSVALYLNDSCLRDIKRSEIAKYPNIKEFQCEENFIITLRSHVFAGNSKLTTLNLCHNVIREIHRQAFHGLTNLESLNLGNNRITLVRSWTFHGLGSLKELDLQENGIQILRKNVFSQLKALEVLDLRGNKISVVDEDAFQGLDSLLRLHLDGNEVDYLHEETFLRTPNLMVLTVSYNKLTAPPSFAEGALMNLHTLNLGHNLIRKLDTIPMANLSKLQNLSLENNSILTVPEDAFHQMPSLRFLNLSSSGIENVGQCSFSHSCHLEELNLSNNRLRTPYPEWFTALIENKAAAGTNIRGNEWKCNCEVISFYEFQSRLSRSWAEALRIRCNWPKEHLGKDLSEVARSLKEDLNCDSEPYRVTERPCNSSIPPLSTRVTTVYTYDPTEAAEKTSDAVSLMLETEQNSYSEAMPFDKQEQFKSPLSIEMWILFAITLAFVFVIVLLIKVYCKRKRNQRYAKSDSTQKMITISPSSSRSDSVETESRNSDETSATLSTTTGRSREFSGEFSITPEQTTPLQPQSDMKSGSTSSSDSGVYTAQESVSSITSSEVAVSIESDRNERTILSIPKNGITHRMTPSITMINETIPKRIDSDSDMLAHVNDGGLILEARVEPIGGNDCDGTC